MHSISIGIWHKLKQLKHKQKQNKPLKKQGWQPHPHPRNWGFKLKIEVPSITGIKAFVKIFAKKTPKNKHARFSQQHEQQKQLHHLNSLKEKY